LISLGSETFLKTSSTISAPSVDIIYNLYKEQLSLVTAGFGNKKS
jgi:hypothetical protein